MYICLDISFGFDLTNCDTHFLCICACICMCVHVQIRLLQLKTISICQTLVNLESNFRLYFYFLIKLFIYIIKTCKYSLSLNNN